MTKVALIGYGEVGRILAEDLGAAGHVVTAYDLKLGTPEGAAMQRHARAHHTTLAESPAQAVQQAELVLSAVTASQTVAAAHACADGLPEGCFFLDLNSASPGAKRAAAARTAEGAGRYVEAAVMAAVPPSRLEVPLLLGGRDAGALQPLLRELGFNARVASAELGIASATKMCRSVMIKGLEAVVIESFIAARHFGVEDAMITSLGETFPSIDWEKQGAYFFQRVIEHGRRRSEELREVAVTVREATLEPWSAAGTAERQAWMADLAEQGLFGERGDHSFARSSDWRVEADRVLDHLAAARPGDGAHK
jgi:3-hydroxyisobutyrate dehydrogenase-like beta-hydroxyacid dehydrogenase